MQDRHSGLSEKFQLTAPLYPSWDGNYGLGVSASGRKRGGTMSPPLPPSTPGRRAGQGGDTRAPSLLPTVRGCDREYTMSPRWWSRWVSAICQAWPSRPGPAPLHARRDDSGDMVLRSGSPPGGPTDDPEPRLAGRALAPAGRLVITRPWLAGKGPDADRMEIVVWQMTSGQTPGTRREIGHSTAMASGRRPWRRPCGESCPTMASGLTPGTDLRCVWHPYVDMAQHLVILMTRTFLLTTNFAETWKVSFWVHLYYLFYLCFTYGLFMIYLWIFGITKITYDLLMIYLWIS